MKLDNAIFNLKTKNARATEIVLAAFLIMSLLVSCNPESNSQQTYDGINFIAPTGSPPVDTITWSPNEDKILVTAGDVGQGRAQVYLLDLVTGKKKLLVNTDYGDIVASTWAPDGKHILLLARQNTLGSGAGGLWILDTQDDSLEYILDSGFGVWSPNGETIAAFSVEGLNTVTEKIALSLVDIDKKTVTKIYENSSAKYFFGLSWSPNGENLVFSLGKEDPGNLYIINIQTKKVTQITENIRSTAPAWSPAGNIIAYVSWPSKGTKKTLHLINSDGKCDIQIPNLEYVWSPTWSPDGSKLGYVGRDGIYFLEIDKVLGRDIYQNLCE